MSPEVSGSHSTSAAFPSSPAGLPNFLDFRVLYITLISIVIAFLAALLSQLLLKLIDFFTNLFFFGRFSILPASPADHHLGIFVIFVPSVVGVIVGFMAGYGAKGMRGHG